MNTQAMHFADNYLIDPTNPITINLIGAGGTGSNMLTALAKINHSQLALGHTGFQLQLFDDDRITEANLGRQLFARSELGLYKSVALVNRFNCFFGSNWKAVPERFTSDTINRLPDNGRANIFITCVDTVQARFDIAAALKHMAERKSYNRNKVLYWMDTGNSHHTGQVLLSTLSPIQQPNSKLYRTVAELPLITEEFKTLLEAQIDNNEPSCSLAEAIEKQDLFINPTLANMGASLLWNLFRRGMTENRGFFLNLETFQAQPIKVG